MNLNFLYFLVIFNLSHFRLSLSLKLLKPSYRSHNLACQNSNNERHNNNKIINPTSHVRSQIIQYGKFSLAAFIGTSGLIIYKSVTDDQKVSQLTKELFQNIKSGMNILEIGFGEGVNLDFYPSYITLKGLDPNTNKVSVSKLKSKYSQKSIDLEIINGVCEALPFPNSTFDVVVSTLVFCSVTDPQLCLKEISRVLKPGGLFISKEHILADEDDVNLNTQSQLDNNQSEIDTIIFKNNLLSIQQTFLDPLQVVVADGCHLNSHTDKLFMSSLNNQNNNSETTKPLFSSIANFHFEEFSSQWPISRQVFVCLLK